MKVQVTAAGLLEEYLPADSDGEMTVQASDGSTLVTVMQAAGIPESAAPLISLNGIVVPRSQHATPDRVRRRRGAFHAESEGGLSAVRSNRNAYI